MDFWFTGCGPCRQTAPYLKKLEKLFEGKPVTFISVSIDKDKEQWLKSVKSEQYASADIINLYTNGEGAEHKIIQHYDINSFPTLILIDKQGRLCPNPVNPRIDDNKDLISKINNALKN
jgi:thiol-disulfide isomerase/thioredoxin